MPKLGRLYEASGETIIGNKLLLIDDQHLGEYMSKKQGIQAVIFIIIFCYLLITVTYIIRTNGEVKDIFTGFYAEEDNSIDVVMIGSSPVYPFYAAPQIWGEYGISCYPLSSHVQRPSAALPLIREAYKTQDPELLIFEMRMYTMEEEHMETNMAYARGVTDNMKYSLNRIYAINRLVPDKKERYTYYFDIFKYHSNWKTMILLDQLASFRYEKKSPLKGFPIRDEVGPLNEDRIPACTGNTELLRIPQIQEERLYELLDYLTAQGQEALFIVSPYRIDEDEQKMYNYMKPIIEEYGFTFINFNQHYDEIGIDFATDYYDYGGHVNALGAAKCSAYLGKILQADYHLTDKRQQAGYESWHQAYTIYKEESEAAIAVIYERIRNQDYAQE